MAFATRRRNRAPRAGVRESGQGPDDPDGRTGACWHHRTPIECEQAANRLLVDRNARRLTSIGIDCMIWIHARKALDRIPQRPFLEKFEPSRRWLDGATPQLGLARAAVLYHLPVDALALTAAEMFERSNMHTRICPAEAEWLEAERAARFSFFQVTEAGRGGVRLRDWFGSLSGRRDLVIEPDELDAASIRSGHTVFARVVPYRNEHFVDLSQSETCFRMGIADPAAPARHAWAAGRNLRNRSEMLETLFESWNRWRKNP